MATSEVAVAVQPADTVVDAVKRAREFYRYLQPDNLVLPSLVRRPSTVEVYNESVPSLSAALAPFCQLTALRTNVRKAMLNVMDRDVMYFLAEASRVKTVTGDQDFYEFVEDPVMMACSSVPLKGRICELTLGVAKENKFEVPMFTINDLSKSDFAQLGPVAGPPYYRFYAGTPIATSSGVNIGSLAVMDTEPRDGLSAAEIEFLGKTASQIMTYLETNRQAIEGRRARRLAEGLEAFIAGKKSIHDDGINGSAQKSSRKRKGEAYGITIPSSPEMTAASLGTSPTQSHRPPPLRARTSLESIPSETSTSETTTDSEQQKSTALDAESRSHSNTFARAANLLRESFGDLGEDGTVVFMSLTSRLHKPSRSPLTGKLRRQSTSSLSSLKHNKKSTDDVPFSPTVTEADVVASSTWASPLAASEETQLQPPKLSEDMLRELMQRYPGGKLWSFDDPGRLSSSEEDSIKSRDTFSSEHSQRGSRRKNAELRALSAAFPHARQVLFAPIWNPGSGSFQQAVFVTASADTRSLSSTAELSFLNSYCSTVMAECSRIDTMKADKQKGDFVGTISHEMRSPLHGILASVEFLADTELTNFQESLVDTVESCGRTLLDTINHVLDFSKVNSFQKHWEASNKRTSYANKRKHYLGPESTSKAYSHGAPPLLQLFAVTDVSAVLEEVVDGLVLGQTFASGVDIMDMSKEARGRGNKHSQTTDLPQEDVQVVLDVQQADWAFLTQPGAVRRIVLNLTGNALKYTTHGTITISLDLKPSEIEGSELMVLRVTDTGKGISQDFMSTKLFVPFAQENALAPGTGLGMSIVHSIVTMLGGTIHVKSQVGKGTTVEVALPLKRPLRGQTSTANTPHSGGTTTSSGSRPDESLQLLQAQVTDSRVAYYRRDRTLANEKLNDILCRYVRDWYGLEFVDPRMIASANVVIAQEEDLDDLMSKVVGTPGQRPALIILCSVASRHSSAYISKLESRINGAVGFVSKPVGPYKLAKSIRLALQKLQMIKLPLKEVTNLGVIPEQDPSEGITPLTSADPAVENVVENLKEMDLSPRESNPSQVVQASETMAISQRSQNAQMAVTTPSIEAPVAPSATTGGFPFPDQNHAEEILPITKQTTIQSPTEPIPTPKKRRRTSSLTQVNGTPLVNPRILLVDDNKINLRLLQTFLKKQRRYTCIDLAEDGQQAVDVFTLKATLADGYEIVFMDISMPVMNGFEATRAIREYEEQNSPQGGKGAMVIALTGLASGKDQAEGFDAGVDIYLTKPVSFREVGKLLDNWEAHQKLKEVAGEMPAASQGGEGLSKMDPINGAVGHTA